MCRPSPARPHLPQHCTRPHQRGYCQGPLNNGHVDKHRRAGPLYLPDGTLGEFSGGWDRVRAWDRSRPTHPQNCGPSSVLVSAAVCVSSCTSPAVGVTRRSSTSPAVGVTGRGSTVVRKRQQAVLKLLSLGEKRHTAHELLQGLTEQTDCWLSPLSLQPGMVVCDNGRNLVAALQLGSLTHVPCLAHVFNLVVQRFLKSYPRLSDLLGKVRRLIAHFRKSNTDAATLRTLQHRFNLPVHRLLCDVPSRWNSTLHMLARLY
ncbi:hypothetical protein GDO78_016867 [Eleutherodactylus coqui]|uniref:Uncharacterized protein n=1 Tax=Eleutherodactylus coqui TaxID=57060 RepID=A0A8J6ECS6_ELECQ|nr:hypothetical protein GDO78_016867 [Eleutherodactylus coqui]